MARFEEKQALTSTYSPVREDQQEGINVDMEDVASPSGCCCFGFGGWKQSNQESKYLLQQNNNNGEQYLHKEAWFANKLKKLKEFSELVAGPRWKNFIRKIGRYCNPKKSSKSTQCMYSPHSYALNFDDGHEEEEEDDMFVSFSSRFPGPLSSDKQRTTTTSSS